MKKQIKHGNEFANGKNKDELLKFIYKEEKRSIKRFRIFAIIVFIILYFILIYQCNQPVTA